MRVPSTRQSRRYADNPRDTAVYQGQRPSGSLFRKNKTNKEPVFRYGLGEYVYLISGLYLFLFGQEVLYKHRQTHQPKNQQKKEQIKETTLHLRHEDLENCLGSIRSSNSPFNSHSRFPIFLQSKDLIAFFVIMCTQPL